MKRKMAQRRPWFLWIGGACFLVGSLVAGSVGLASSAGPPNQTVTSNQGSAGSSSWPVSASQSGTWQQEITDGTNVLGTPTNPLRTDPTGTTTQPVSGTVNAAQGTGTGSGGAWKVDGSGVTQPVSGTVGISGSVKVAAPDSLLFEAICTVVSPSANCQSTITGLAVGTVINTLSVYCTVATGQHVFNEFFTTGISAVSVPLSLQASTGGTDYYAGTLTNMGIPIQMGAKNTFGFDVDYTAGGADCNLTFVGTQPS